jgi:hypothetical protein
MDTKFLCRYEMSHFEGVARLYLVEHTILGKTPKGVYIEISYGRKRWVGNTTRNRYAHNTEREALKHFIRRKSYRNHCIELELVRNESVLAEAKYLLHKDDKQGKKQTTKRDTGLNKYEAIRTFSRSSKDW